MYNELHDYVLNNEKNICQIVVFKDGKEIYSDEWNNYKKDDAVHVMSVTKSIVSLLIGICIDKGLIKSVDDKVLDYFPEYEIKRGEKTIQDVTIKHLLTMKAPYKCKYEPWTKVCISDDWALTSLDFLGGRKGLTGEFRYMTVCLHILTGIISRVSNMTTVEFANKYLFEPIGVKEHKNFLALTAEEHKAWMLSKEPKGNEWFCDPLGIGTAGYGLCFSALDLAKIGNLCLNNGFINGKQIISSNWIKEMIKVTHKCGEEFNNGSYGYLWWIVDDKKGIYAAIGNSGNIIYVNPNTKTVVGITGYFKPTIFDRVEFIQKYLDKE